MQNYSLCILGPTGTGKTALSQYLASYTGFSILNCDSIQMYQNLRHLSNKPDFILQHSVQEEWCSIQKFISIPHILDYENIDFHLILPKQFKGENLGLLKKNEGIISLSPVNFFIFLNSFRHNSLLTEIPSYLFDITPLENKQSLIDFIGNVNRITRKLQNQPIILCGGTMYYAYHYLRGTKMEKVIEIVSEDEITYQQNVAILRKEDPKLFQLIQMNPRRAAKAVAYLLSTGKQYSVEYVKRLIPRSDTVSILLYPKDRKRYYETLDVSVRERIRLYGNQEILILLNKYGDKIRKQLRQISYEYAYALEIFDHPDRSESLLQELCYKEHQYAKRQITFMRKLERELN